MLSMAYKNLISRKTRSFLCIIAIIVSVYLNGSTATMNKWMYETMTSELAKYMGKIYVQQGGSSYPPFDSTISDTLVSDIFQRGNEDINLDESTPLIFVRIEKGMMPFMAAQAMVIGLPMGKEGAFLGNVEAASGKNRFTDQLAYEVILGEKAADYFKAEVGEEITINNKSLRVVGILKRSSMDSVNISAIAPIATVQSVFQKKGTVSAVLLTAKDVNKVSEIADTLRQVYIQYDVTTQDDMEKDAQKVLRMPMMYMRMMSLTAFIVAIAVLMSTMMMAMIERTKEIGTLLAIGIQRKFIIGSLAVEMLIISLIGGIFGALLVIPMASVMETSLPTPWQLVRIVLFAVLAATISALLPAFRASKVEPIEALRYE